MIRLVNFQSISVNQRVRELLYEWWEEASTKAG